MVELAPVARTSRPLKSAANRRRYSLVVGVLGALSVALVIGLVVWDNPMPFASDGYWRIATFRSTNVVVIALVAVCQAVATVTFQTVANNRIITPSIMGFESMYVAVQTGAVFFLGSAGVVVIQGASQFLLQVGLMVGFALLLYGWLLSGPFGNLHIMLLVGIVIGGGLGSVSTFMQRMLTPSEFDVLTARLFGSIANADATYLPYALPLAGVSIVLIWLQARRLNVLALGKEAATALGIAHRRQVIGLLILVSILMAVSTSLVGPMTFLGFLVAMLAYQLADSHDHRLVLPVAALTGFVTLAGGYFVIKNIFSAQGAVTIVIEMVGGLAFLFVLLRKGRL